MSDKNIIRITRHHSTRVTLRSGNKPEVIIPVGPIFDLDSVDQYDADELRGILNDSHVEYETVGADAQAPAGSVGGSDALSAGHVKPDPSVSATMTSGIQPESDDRKDELQPDAYGGDLEGDDSDVERGAAESGKDNAKGAGAKDTGNEETDEESADPDREELLALLDQNVADLTESLKGRSEAELRALRRAEQDGKSRSSALKAIDEALNPEGGE